MLRILFYWLVVKPLALIILGIKARGVEHLPQQGPAVIVANHNSHLDTLALMALLPSQLIHKVHPVAAADYFCKTPWLNWFAVNVIGIIPLDRNNPAAGREVLNPVLDALDRDAILIFFPEGTRGEPEMLGKMKSGVAFIVSERPQVPVIPVFFYGLGKCLPKGEILLIPFFVDAFIGEPQFYSGHKHAFMQQLNAQMLRLQAKADKVIQPAD
jgi:1-acyl-sn-glycerol-3-phosphate acyltransferase